ncbi:hypothetical protein BGZ61DRAFT_472061 [Ilyonectria robusta]|uniref:uncharacterized protein n=1 Tax=Ilyonectria robusta TaxID=1079257 RepID=UPI001E8E722B|nr:uncharacterized protein BGZ61DRAFT_472061 [Ilyonectria robusta]KAH8735647.1 hypothetical protein BGZ61DRAFT_472061 [Ilyonectria robusta]
MKTLAPLETGAFGLYAHDVFDLGQLQSNLVVVVVDHDHDHNHQEETSGRGRRRRECGRVCPFSRRRAYCCFISPAAPRSSPLRSHTSCSSSMFTFIPPPRCRLANRSRRSATRRRPLGSLALVDSPPERIGACTAFVRRSRPTSTTSSLRQAAFPPSI